MPDPTGSLAGAAHHQATVPGGRGQPRLPLMCCNRARPRRTSPLPSSGASVAGPGVAISWTRPGPAGLPQTGSRRHPPDQPGMTMQPLGTSAPWWIHRNRCPLRDRPRRLHRVTPHAGPLLRLRGCRLWPGDPGPYAVVRHPVYASYLLIQSGYLLQSISLRNAVVMVLASGCNVGRALVEERLLTGSSAYGAYRRRVRWRLVPCLW
jgi:hypothetical protein